MLRTFSKSDNWQPPKHTPCCSDEISFNTVLFSEEAELFKGTDQTMRENSSPFLGVRGAAFYISKIKNNVLEYFTDTQWQV